MLVGVRDYISERGSCSLADISSYFKMSPDAMRGVLSHWIRKGKIKKEFSGCSSGCVSCAPEILELYYWKDGSCNSHNIPLCNLL
ncbi:MAG: FeoC-like transcriptional regulator [Candidatus Endonucleobacter bathymodioli]|uniref:FeoC-like transcriptional regulator n=1 Tax=Candidatus Endonucleibacter bathymodioli TaxID=539814 RepID=A0AA90NLQ7_9GAMM|nr:FeoC-like transcriptional regulator [Candidatus Endonucleobacter bathymodioli]